LKQVDRDINQVINYEMHKEAKTDRSKVTVRILICGDPGVGKSSFVNTARAVFNKQVYEEDAGVGEGGATVTG
jgi:GTPase SAR1 family protein